MSTWRKRMWMGAVGAGVVAGLTVLLVLASWLWLRSDAGNRWMAKKALEAAAGGGAEVELVHFETDLWSHARLEGLTLSTPDGTRLMADSVDLRFDGTTLISDTIRAPRLEVTGLSLDMRASEEAGEGFAGLGVDLVVEEVVLKDAALIYRNTEGTPVVQLATADGVARFESRGPHLLVDVTSISSDLTLTGTTQAEFEGQVRVDHAGAHLEGTTLRLPDSQVEITGLAGPELDLALEIETLAGKDLDALLGDVGLQGRVHGKATVGGTGAQPTWTAELEGPAGALSGSGTIDNTGDTLAFTADLDLDQLAAEQLVDTIGDTVVLTGKATLEGRGTAWPDELELDIHWLGEAHDVYGQQIDGIESQITIRQGMVKLTNTALDGILGDLLIEGDLDAVDGPTDLHVTGRIRPHRLRELGIEGINRSGFVDARLTGNPLDPTAPYHVVGRVRFGPFLYGSDVRYDKMVIDFDALMAGTDFEGTASVEASGGSAYGVQLATTSVKQLGFDISSAGMFAEGDFHGTDLVYPDALYLAVASGAWTFDDGAIGADLDLGPLNLLEFPGTHGTLSARIDGDLTRFKVDMRDGARGLLQTQGVFDTAQSHLSLDDLALRPTPRTEWRMPSAGSFRLTDGGIADAQLQLLGHLGNFSVLGTVGTTGPLAGTVEITGLSLDVLSELEPDLSPTAGTLDLYMDLAGTAADPTISGTVLAERVWMEDLTRWLDISGEFEVADGALTTQLDLGVAGEDLSHVQGTIPVRMDLSDPWVDPDGEIDLQIALSPGGLYRFERAFPAAAGTPQGQMGGVLTVSGLMADPDIRAAGIAELDVPGWVDPARVVWDWTRTRSTLVGWFDVRDGAVLRATARGVGRTELRSITEQLAREGTVPEEIDYTALASGMVVEGEFIDFPASSLTTALGLDVAMTGDVAGNFAVRGDPIRPRTEADLRWYRGSLGAQDMTDASLRITPTEDGYRIASSGRFVDGGDLHLEGDIPLRVDLRTDPETWAHKEMNLLFRGDGLPLKVITAIEPSLQHVEGLIQIKGGVRGTPFDPLPTLSMTMADGAMRVPSLGLKLDQWSFDVRATHREVIVQDFRVRTGPHRRRRLGSELQDLTDESDSLMLMAGRATLQDGVLQDVEAGISLEGGTWVLNTNEAVLRSEGDLNVTGTWPALQVRGDLALRSGRVTLDSAAFLDRAPLTPDPRLHILRPTGSITAKAEAPPWYQDVNARVKLDLKRNLELDVSMPFVDDFGALGAAVSRADLSSRIGGTSTMILREGEPRMTGELDILEGSLRVFRSRFSVQEGTIQFTGADITDPLMDITAQMKIPSATINARISGPPSNPDPEFTSEEIADETDILMVLLTGQLPEQLSAEGGAGAGNALAGLLVGSILAGQELGNLTFEPDGSVTASVPVSQAVYATTSFSPDARDEENTFTGELEWGLAPRVVLDTGVGNIFSWMDLYWEIRF